MKVGNHSAQESGSRFRRAHDLDTDSDYERHKLVLVRDLAMYLSC